MSRFLLSVWMFFPVCVLSLATQSKAQDRPNFIFIYTDDQRWDALGVVQREQGEKGRFPWIQSPNLDRLASEGVRFRNAFVVTALCAPSRAAFLTGRHGHANGIVNNHTPFAESSVTHASLLRAAGYRTAYVGKWHMGSQSGQRPGFDYSASFVGQGVFFDCPIEINGVKTPTKGWVDDVSTEHAIRFIRENRDQPFSLVLGYKTCHGPFTPPPRTQDAYPDAQARVVPSLTVPAIYKQDAVNVDPNATLVKTNLGMFRGLKAIDENVGKLLAVLDECQLTENTVVVYSSDNGYYLGEHGLGDKRSAYDEAMRIPLLLRYPRLGLKGRVIDQLVLNIDLAPTWLDLAGVPIPQQMQGRSWKPLLVSDSPQVEWRTSFFYEYFREGRFAAPSLTALRTDTAKLIKYPGHDDWTEVFDLKSDPYEIKNLANSPAHQELRRQLETEYDRQASAVQYHVPEFADERNPGVAAVPRAPLNAWVLDYRLDQDAGQKGQQILDASELKNHGRSFGTKLVEGRDGRKALEFNGKSHIEVPVTSSLDPSTGAIVIEASFQAKADGVVLARGGQSLGYLLAVTDGKPTFSYRTQAGLKTVSATKSVLNEWVTLRVRVTPEKQLKLEVNGAVVAEAPVTEFIHQNPTDGLQVGADLRSQVLNQPAPQFQGLIERVRIAAGSVD